MSRQPLEMERVEILVNGEPTLVPANLTLSQLLQELEVLPDRVAIELNKCIVRKRHWAETPVCSGSQIEIVQFVGGG